MKTTQPLFRVVLLIAASISGLATAKADFTPSLAPVVSADGWTRVNDDDDAITYSDNIHGGANNDYYNKDMHSGTAVGEWCTFSFVGTGVKWIGGKADNHGKADVYIDGKLDATVDSSAPLSSWLKQQEIYTKTGLSNGPHLFMFRIKTSGYQDVDAFEFQAHGAAPKMARETSLPENAPAYAFLPLQVPYLNPPRHYPIGNGADFAVSQTSGEWNQLSGPGYSTPNFISSESLTLEVDGAEKPLVVAMKRARETGVYYGVTACGDLLVHLIDYAGTGRPWLSRLVIIDSTPGAGSHDVRVEATVMPAKDPGITHRLVDSGDQKNCGMTIQADTTADNPGFGGKNVATKSVVISFTDPASTAALNGEAYSIRTPVHRIGPGESYRVALGHYFRQDKTSDSDCLAGIRAIKSVGELGKTISKWQSWITGVAPGFRLGKIKDERARNLMEGALVILKTNQSADGGFAANLPRYSVGYFRDTTLGLRGMVATGHFDESKNWLHWAAHKFSLFGHIPDNATCEASVMDPSNKLDCGNLNVEQTALTLLCARDYYAGTQDLQTLNAVHDLLQFCMDIQLKEAVANGYKLDFNGDETEICSAVDLSQSGTVPETKDFRGNIYPHDWSMPSIALCAASLDFYIDYLKARGESVEAYKNTQTGTTMNLKTERDRLLKAMHADFWRTDVAEIPGGFHDSFRVKINNGWPARRITDFTLMPVYYGTSYPTDEKAKDVAAMAHYYNEKTGFLQLMPGSDDGFDGHTPGYLLWSLVEVGDPRKTEVYQALVNSKLPDCWGSYTEEYNASGDTNWDDLRTMETGCNVSAIAKYWDLKR